MITDYHAKYFAHELSKTGGTGVDLTPHQVVLIEDEFNKCMWENEGGAL
jgi:hypothetical protein